MTQSLNQWFCLKDGKENFTIVPERDQAFLFGKAQWREQIENSLKIALVLKEPTRLVWWGDFGIGKTHRLQYMSYFIEQAKLDFLPVQVTCRDLTTKSGFDSLHYDLVNNLDFARVRVWAAGYRKKVEAGIPQAVPFTRLSAVVDVANAMERLGDASIDLAQSAWEFLVGQKLPKGGAKLANVAKDQIDSSVEYASVLRCMAWLVKVETGQELLYLIDQMETLTNITNRDFENAWVETLRAILDIRELGIVCTLGGLRQELLPAIMLRPEIVSRFKLDNYLRLPQYEPEVAADFLRDLFREWIDSVRRDDRVSREQLDGVPGYSATTYPFTEPAFESFCAYLTNDPRDAKPREILERLNKVAAYACIQGVPLITKDELMRQGINA